MATTWYKIGENAWISDGGGSYVTYLPATDEPEYTVTVNINPSESGVVNGSGTFTKGTTITLNAVPNEGYMFSSWSDGTTGNPYIFELTEDVTLTANFVATGTITVAANPSTYGTVSGAGTYQVGSEVQLVATPILGYKFVDWNDGDTNATRNITVVEGTTNYVANFRQLSSYTVATSVTPDASGTIDGAGVYNEGTSVTLIAKATKGYKFKKWSNGVTTRIWTFTISGDINVTAIFEIDTSEYTLTLNVNPADSGTVTGAGTYVAGKTVKLTATPAENYVFSSWSDGTLTEEYNYTIYEDTTLTANFNYVEPTEYYTITTVAEPSAGGTISGGGTYAKDSVIELEATAAVGYEFSSWSTGALTNKISVIVDGNKTITANFDVVTTKYTINLISEPIEAGILTGDGEYEKGATVTISETHDETKYRFKGWYILSETTMGLVTESSIYSFKITENATLYARYDDLSKLKTINITSSDTTKGAVTGSGTYTIGMQVTAYAKPNEGYEFEKWSNGITSNPYYFNVVEDVTLIGYFKVKPISDSLVSFNSNSVQVASKLTGTILNYDSQYTYKFYWTSSLDSIEREFNNVGEFGNVELLIDNIFESISINSSSYTITITCKKFNGDSLISYQNNINITVNIGNEFIPTVSFGNITWSGLFNSTIVAGYSTYQLPMTVTETAPVGYENHANINTPKVSTNYGQCSIIPGNNSKDYLIIGTAQSSTIDYDLEWKVTASDSRQKSIDKTHTYQKVTGYSYPRLSLLALYLCDDMGVESKTGNNIFIAFTPVITEIEGNTIDPNNCYITLNNGETRYPILSNENIFYAIVGDNKVMYKNNYILTVSYYDEVMNTLAGSMLQPLQTTYTLNSKLPLSLLDDLDGNVGVALGVEASHKNNVEISLDTTFNAGVNLNASKYDGAIKDTVSRTGYDLLNDGGINSIIKKDTVIEGTNYYASIIRCMDGETYENLDNLDAHTLYFLTSVPPKEKS